MAARLTPKTVAPPSLATGEDVGHAAYDCIDPETA